MVSMADATNTEWTQQITCGRCKKLAPKGKGDWYSRQGQVGKKESYWVCSCTAWNWYPYKGEAKGDGTGKGKKGGKAKQTKPPEQKPLRNP